MAYSGRSISPRIVATRPLALTAGSRRAYLGPHRGFAKARECSRMASDQTEPPEVIYVSSKRVACDGVGGALGHPRVWLEMGEANFVECLYCDRRFVLKAGAEGTEDEL